MYCSTPIPENQPISGIVPWKSANIKANLMDLTVSRFLMQIPLAIETAKESMDKAMERIMMENKSMLILWF
jgi:hypothetical protein